MLLARTPTVGAVAVSIRNENGRSLLCGSADALSTYQVEVTLTFATELQMTLVQDIIDGHIAQCSQAGTLTNLVYITSSLGSTATCLEQQLGSIQQGLRIAVDALVVVIVQVL